MSERLGVSLPKEPEELRAWAQAVSDMHYTGCLVMERAQSYLPGETIETVRLAWVEVTKNFQKLTALIHQGGQGLATV